MPRQRRATVGYIPVRPGRLPTALQEENSFICGWKLLSRGTSFLSQIVPADASTYLHMMLYE